MSRKEKSDLKLSVVEDTEEVDVETKEEVKIETEEEVKSKDGGTNETKREKMAYEMWKGESDPDDVDFIGEHLKGCDCENKDEEEETIDDDSDNDDESDNDDDSDTDDDSGTDDD